MLKEINQIPNPAKKSSMKHRFQDWLIDKLRARIGLKYVGVELYDYVLEENARKEQELKSAKLGAFVLGHELTETKRQLAAAAIEIQNTRKVVESHMIGGWTREVNVAGTVIQIHIPNTGMPQVEKLQQELAVAVKDVPTTHALNMDGVISLKELEKKHDFPTG